MAKCKNETNGTVSAFGKLLFIKSGDVGKENSFVIKLNIKRNKVMLGHGGDEGTVLNELLKSLFGTTSNFEFVTADKAAAAAGAAAAGAAAAGAGLVIGGKSTRRKRKGSRKKGSTKKPVSHKKRKRGASKKRRSHPKKK